MALACASACKKDKFKPNYSNGKATAVRNEKSWTAQGRGNLNNLGVGFDMSFGIADNAGIQRQDLSFIKIPTSEGQYTLHNTSSQSQDSISGCSFVTLSHDGDVVEDRYDVLETVSTVTVLEYDDSEHWCRGAFKLKLYLDPTRPKANPNNPDTLVFENGKFEVRIEK